MFRKKLHLHSMIVHVIAALAPLAAVAFILLKTDTPVLSFTNDTWAVFVNLSIPIMFIVSLPSIMTGIFERGHIYAKWHSAHKIKLFSSVVLVLALIGEMWLLLPVNGGLEGAQLMGPLGILIIIVNNIANVFLGVYGLKISLGRQGLSSTSYEPDLFKKEPFDILTRVGQYTKEKPKYIDLYEEKK